VAKPKFGARYRKFVARQPFGERFKVLLIGAVCFPPILAEQVPKFVSRSKFGGMSQ